MLSYYYNFLSPELIEQLWLEHEDVPSIEGLRVAKGLRVEFEHIETVPALQMVVSLYERTKESLFNTRTT